MASTTISDVSEARWARDLYSATLARLSLPELPYFVPTLDASPMQIARTAKDDHSELAAKEDCDESCAWNQGQDLSDGAEYVAEG
jgi:hypothetical protein